MLKFIPWKDLLASWVAPVRLVEVLAEVLQAILQAGSARWSDIARQMSGSEAAAYKRLGRLVARFDPREVLRQWCVQDAPIVILDATEVERPYAYRTEYVGGLPPKEETKRRRRSTRQAKTGQETSERASRSRRGFWLLLLGLPFRGRVLPWGWWTYSSKTLDEEATSQNLVLRRFLEDLRQWLQTTPCGGSGLSRPQVLGLVAEEWLFHRTGAHETAPGAGGRTRYAATSGFAARGNPRMGAAASP